MDANLHHEVKVASAILAEDAICQGFILGSSTLAYACILIRQKKYALASQVLLSLEAKKGLRFKDIVFYLQAQIGIETGDFVAAKQRLVDRVQQNAEDLLALALLESCIYEEWKATPSAHVPISATMTPATLPSPGAEPTSSAKIPVQEEPGFGPYSHLTLDANTQAMAFGNQKQSQCFCRNPHLEPLMKFIPEMVPGALSAAIHALEGGEIRKITMSFQNLSFFSLHQNGDRLDLLTDNLNQSLLTQVRAENIFKKQAAAAMGPAGIASPKTESKT